IADDDGLGAAAEAAGLLVGGLTRQLIGVGIGRRVDTGDMADAAGLAETDHRQDLALRLAVAADEIADDGGIGPAVRRRAVEAPFQRVAEMVEANHRLRRRRLVLRLRAEGDEEAEIALADPHRYAAI